jgi:hypothetical protein
MPSLRPSIASNIGATGVPTGVSTGLPSGSSIGATGVPTTGVSTGLPSGVPTAVSTLGPSGLPAQIQTGIPTGVSTGIPTLIPTGGATGIPTGTPTGGPTGTPTSIPTSLPTGAPTIATAAPTLPGPIVSATPYALTYIGARPNVDGSFDFISVGNITVDHVARIVDASLATRPPFARIEFQFQDPVGNTGQTVPPTLGLSFTIFYSPDTTNPVTTAELDLLISNSFQQPEVQSLLDDLAATRLGFSLTREIFYQTTNVPTTNTARSVPVETIPQQDSAELAWPFVGAFAGTFALMIGGAAVASLLKRKQRWEESMKGKSNGQDSLAISETSSSGEEGMEIESVSSRSSSSFFLSPESAFNRV